MELEEIVNLQIEINPLKKTGRFRTCDPQMWESTTDHSWQLARFVLDVIPKLNLHDLNLTEVYGLALDHDLAEYPDQRDVDSMMIVRGDFSREYKRAEEERVIKALAEKYNEPAIYERWLDYEDGRTKEAKFVKAIDKIGSMIHMLERRMKTGRDDDKDHNVLYADKAVQAFPSLTPLLKVVKAKMKTQYKVLGLEWKPEYDKV